MTVTDETTTTPVSRRGDRVFEGIARASGLLILVALAGVAIFLTVEGIPGMTADQAVYGAGKDSFVVYVWPLVFGTVLAAVIALLIATPLSIGVALVIVAFVIVFVRGIRAAFRASDEYGTYLAVGITMFLGLQAFTNLAVVMGMLPTKGLALPFLSYGGSSLLVNSAAVGVLLNVSRPRAPQGAAVQGASVKGRARPARELAGGAA